MENKNLNSKFHNKLALKSQGNAVFPRGNGFQRGQYNGANSTPNTDNFGQQRSSLNYQSPAYSTSGYYPQSQARWVNAQEFFPTSSFYVPPSSSLTKNFVPVSNTPPLRVAPTVPTKRERLENVRKEKNLPIYNHREKIIQNISNNKFSIVVGETGCGKSTQLPQYLLEHYEAKPGSTILWVLPRKLAATSLAQRVCEEMEFTLGKEVGYELPSRKEVSGETVLKFTTDTVLINELIQKHLNGKITLDYSIVVLDEVHERNLYTDILLAILKDVAKNSEMKLVVTSATINEAIFERYFGIKAIQIQGRPYPVEIEYNPIPEGFDPAMHMANAVWDVVNRMERGKFHYEGHILVFTSGIEEITGVETILKEQKKIKLKKYEIMPLHGLLSPGEQKAIFRDNGKTKIILSTRLAETALTIDGVSVVIDLGVDKEGSYDPMRRINIVANKPIPWSSAVQRAGRAGRTKQGLCIRLYSGLDFEKMARNKKPEIQRMNLSKLVLKLKAIGVKDIKSFDFIEKPDERVLTQTIEHLEMLEALDANEALTPIGKAMLKFDIEPDFARVIIEGIRRNCAYETAAIVAMIGVNSGLFRRGVEKESQEEADTRKLAVCHKKGDLLTLYNIFWCWTTVQEQDKENWCMYNYLSLPGLKEASKVYEDLTKEIQAHPDFNANLAQNAQAKPKKGRKKAQNVEEEKEEKEDTVLKCFLRVFFSNVCEYTEIPKVGYILLKDIMTLKIHGASSLALIQENPKYIICIDINNTFYNNTKVAAAIKREWIEEIFPKYKENPRLKYLAKSYAFQQHVQSNLGNHVLAYFGYNKLPEIKEKAESCEYLFIPDYKEEKLYIYSSNKSGDEIQQITQELIQKIKQDLDNETIEIPLTLRTRCIFEKGAKIREILLNRDTRFLRFEGFDLTHNEYKLLDTLNQTAKVEYVFSDIDPVTNLRCGVICMESSKEVKKVLEFYKPDRVKQVFGSVKGMVSARMNPVNLESNASEKKALRVRMEWYVGEPTGKCSLLFENDLFAYEAYDKLQTGVMIDGKYVRDSREAESWECVTISIPRKNNCMILLHGLTDRTNEPMLHRVLDQHDIRKGFISLKVLRKMDIMYSPLNPLSMYCPVTLAVEIIRNKLLSIFPNDMDKMYIPEPEEAESDKYERKIDLEVYDIDVAKRIQWYFNGQVLFDGVPLSCTLSYMRKIVVKKENYSVISDELKQIFKKIRDEKGHTVKIIEDTREFIMFDNYSQGVLIRVIAEDPQIVDRYYNVISVAAKGIPFQLEDNTELKKAEFESIKEKVKGVEKENKVSIELDKKRRLYVLFGKRENREKAYQALESVFRGKKKEEDIHEEKINIRYHPIRHLIENSDVLFKEIAQKFQVDVSFSILSKEILVMGKEADVCGARKEIEKVIKIGGNKETNENECPICYETYVEGYRLQVCGHKFCYVCLEAELNETLNNNPQFPLMCSQCLAEDKKSAICVKDLKTIMKSRVTVLWERSVERYLKMNETAYFRCFSANCQQIFTQSPARRFSCDYCLRSYCKKCKEESHEEENCEQSAKKLLEKQLVKMGCKECPHCGEAIEKNGGCYKMKCAYCKTLFCWLCKAVYSTAEDVYAHLTQVHGGIFDDNIENH